jgi:hypothetical protein
MKIADILAFRWLFKYNRTEAKKVEAPVESAIDADDELELQTEFEFLEEDDWSEVFMESEQAHF